MCCFDPEMAAQTMAPNLIREMRLEYLASEMDFIQEMLEDSEDCKWVYQALVECILLEGKVNGGLHHKAKERVRKLAIKLEDLDPLRRGRWLDLKTSMES